ncbi:MAG: hypothetical protein Pars2KO_19330 [Parasphingorhabdus sp.]
MEQTTTLDPLSEASSTNITPAPATGLFGYSIIHGKLQANKPMLGYICDLEQMPNFSPPSMKVFVAQYVASNIGKTKSSS